MRCGRPWNATPGTTARTNTAHTPHRQTTACERTASWRHKTALRPIVRTQAGSQPFEAPKGRCSGLRRRLLRSARRQDRPEAWEASMTTCALLASSRRAEPACARAIRPTLCLDAPGFGWAITADDIQAIDNPRQRFPNARSCRRLLEQSIRKDGRFRHHRPDDEADPAARPRATARTDVPTATTRSTRGSNPPLPPIAIPPHLDAIAIPPILTPTRCSASS
jgi:hypothetical protein